MMPTFESNTLFVYLYAVKIEIKVPPSSMFPPPYILLSALHPILCIILLWFCAFCTTKNDGCI